MKRASIASLKAHLSEYLEAAKAGEEIIVTGTGLSRGSAQSVRLSSRRLGLAG